MADEASAAEVWRDVVRPRLDGYLGHTFERMAWEAYPHLRKPHGLPMIKEWGRWEGRDRNREAVEIDIVARTTDGPMITGAVKWNARPVSATLHTGHLAALHRLAASGYQWAHEALAPEGIFLYVSAAGFADRFAAGTGASGQTVVTWSLEDMYRQV